MKCLKIFVKTIEPKVLGARSQSHFEELCDQAKLVNCLCLRLLICRMGIEIVPAAVL